MAEVAYIGRETIIDFVARCGGVFTSDIASRFGIGVQEARKACKRLEREGRLKSKREIAANGSFSGAGLVWEIP